MLGYGPKPPRLPTHRTPNFPRDDDDRHRGPRAHSPAGRPAPPLRRGVQAQGGLAHRAGDGEVRRLRRHTKARALPRAAEHPARARGAIRAARLRHRARARGRADHCADARGGVRHPGAGRAARAVRQDEQRPSTRCAPSSGHTCGRSRPFRPRWASGGSASGFTRSPPGRTSSGSPSSGTASCGSTCPRAAGTRWT